MVNDTWQKSFEKSNYLCKGYFVLKQNVHLLTKILLNLFHRSIYEQHQKIYEYGQIVRKCQELQHVFGAIFIVF